MTAQAGDITRTPSAKGASRRRLPGSLAWHVGALALLAVILYPVVWVVGGSLKASEDIVGSLDLFPADPIVSNYTSLADGIADISVSTFFLNSLFLAVGSVIGILISCSLTAYAFAKIRFAGRNVLFTLMTQRKPGIDGGKTAILEPEELDD
ncbi:hypothetical protein AB0D90_33115, partial [Streptomyces althioticus]